MNDLNTIRNEIRTANKTVSELTRDLRRHKLRRDEINSDIDKYMKLPRHSDSLTLRELKEKLDATDAKIKGLSRDLETAKKQEEQLIKKFASLRDKRRDAVLSTIRELIRKRDASIAAATEADKELAKAIDEANKQNFFLNKFPVIRDNMKLTFHEVPANWESTIFTQKTVTVGGVTEKL